MIQKVGLATSERTSPMRFQTLGHTEIRVSALGLGGNTFGPPRIDAATTTKVIHAALERGVNFIDTASVYGQGHSEQYVGAAIQGRRADVVVATKFTLGDLGDEAPQHRIRAQCEQSLRRLNTDWIDLLQVHQPSDALTTDELLNTLATLVREGKVRAIGSSNYGAWRIAESHAQALAAGCPDFVTAQNHYNLLHRHPEQDLIPACQRYGVSLIPYHPLAGGFLTGKYRGGEPAPAGTRGAAGSMIVKHVSTDRNWDILAKLERFARERDRGVGELAIAWLVAQPVVSSVITGLSNVDQLVQNINGATWELTAEEIAQVSALTDQGTSDPSEGYRIAAGRR